MFFAAGVALVVAGFPAASAAQVSKPAEPAVQSPAMPTPSAKAPGPDHFVGTWTYDADNSVDAISGKQEQPNSSTPRRGTANGKPTGGSTGGSTSPNNPNNPNNPVGYPGYPGSYPGGYGPGGYGNGSGSGYGGLFPPTPMGLTGIEVNEQRELVRDLMEIPQSLTISVTKDDVTFKDDLDRMLTFPTNNKKQRYQLGAASFDAHAHWDGPQLVVEIEGASGFRMSETYFLSEESNRLFAIYRLGDPKKQQTTPLTGVNRVYNRGTSSR
jgi:hypothetical protein